ncbi:MAG TPA: DUF411 domain-containing protein [Gemmatimonadales bacterium]|nr:DUF411 domain-containing protein [Gemmatimonadales bacterium]
MLDRRSFLGRVAGVLALGLVPRRAWGLGEPASAPLMTVYKSKSCGCCAKWVDHVKAAGFRTVVHDRDPLDPVKDQLGVPKHVRSCHTAQADGYLIEGHVPAADIKRLLRERPKVIGLAVPGMPVGTPGMDQPGAPAEPYHVVAFRKGGETSVFAKY